MEDFLEAKALLDRAGASFMVKARYELVKKPNGYQKIQMSWIAWERGPGKIDIQCFRKLQLISLKVELI